jgi:hypothetical protein
MASSANCFTTVSGNRSVSKKIGAGVDTAGSAFAAPGLTIMALVPMRGRGANLQPDQLREGHFERRNLIPPVPPGWPDTPDVPGWPYTDIRGYAMLPCYWLRVFPTEQRCL